MSNLLLGPLHGVLTPNTDVARRVGVGLQFGVQGVAFWERERVRALAEACAFVALSRVDGVSCAPARDVRPLYQASSPRPSRRRWL